MTNEYIKFLINESKRILLEHDMIDVNELTQELKEIEATLTTKMSL